MKLIEANGRYYELQNITGCKTFNILHYKRWVLNPREWTGHGVYVFFVTKQSDKEFEENPSNFETYDGILSQFEFSKDGSMATKTKYLYGYVNNYCFWKKHILVVVSPKQYLEQTYKIFIEELKIHAKYKLEYLNET
jgi:hypothetical protein